MALRYVQGVFLADTARVMGEVTLGDGVNVWYGAVIRGDVAPIEIGVGANVQDAAIIHCDTGEPNRIGANVTIGHAAVVHGLSVGDGALIGMGARLLGGTRIGARCLVAAGAVVTPNTVAPDDHLVMGVPAKVVRETTDEEKRYLAWLAPHYVELARLHVEQPNDPRVRPFGT